MRTLIWSMFNIIHSFQYSKYEKTVSPRVLIHQDTDTQYRREYLTLTFSIVRIIRRSGFGSNLSLQYVVTVLTMENP
jgi:hypothetical protein